MRLYITSELKQLKEELYNRGFEIVDNAQEDYDAAICNLKSINTAELNYKYNKIEGAIIIDKGSKDINDIENILMNKNNNY
ncbi:Uncharacterised protein family (UPF0180) [Clostridium cavendishii DSM 21758]|uniref:Uncharacterized protein family (UPF0180) n=1 Tax=Clostridium cavendishii DSM 21758 TaxID=1121302 RepID=A0A1M6TK03_9CLOT|nr:YkuS family protein [Clostridium cavendishii]SHK57305.1 Uncharacterised protein family (UPF0180) [Clostridium cavendishii DSM 21758]